VIVREPTIWSSTNQKPADFYNVGKPACDRCGKINLNVYVGNLKVPNVDLCVPCFDILANGEVVGKPTNVVQHAVQACVPQVDPMPVVTSVIKSRDIHETVPLEFVVRTEGKHARATCLQLFQMEDKEAEEGIFKDYHEDLEWIRQNYKPVDVTQANPVFTLKDPTMAREPVAVAVCEPPVENTVRFTSK